MPKQSSVLNQLTTGLMNTFVHINQEYYFHNRIQSNVKRKQVQNEITNTAYYEYKSNECLNNRYYIQSSIGKGSFGEVVLAWDTELKKQVAIKIIRSGDLFFQQSKIEVQIYQLLQTHEDSDRQYIVQLLDISFFMHTRHFPSFYSFMNNGHRCLVFEKLHYNLFDILRYNNFNGISIYHVQRIAYQLLSALRYIHSDKNRIIHSDVKPENILLTEHDGCDIKLIDFGSSSYSGSCIFSYIQSRYYRAPEVILGLPYNASIDLWSVGCVLYEICAGVPLFRGRNQLEQLTLITNALGDPPLSMLTAGKKVEDFYLRTRVRDDGNSRYFLRRISQLLPESLYRSPNDLLSLYEESSKEYELVYELVQLLWRLLAWDSSSRPSAEQALQAPFFQIDASEYLKEGGSLRDTPLRNRGNAVNQQERSCESLSMFLQLRNQPAKLHVSTPSITPLDVIKSQSLHSPHSQHSQHSPSHNRSHSLLSESLLTTKHKHKRNKSTPLMLAESIFAMSSPLEMSFFSPTLTPSKEMETAKRQGRTTVSQPPQVNARKTPIEKPLKLPFKKLTAEDYRTPTPVCKTKLLSHSIISKRPFAEKGQNTTFSRTQILPPPSFDDVVSNPVFGMNAEATSPFQIPFSLSH